MIKNIILDVGRVLVHWDPVFAMKKMGFSEEAIKEIHDRIIEGGLWDLEDKGCMEADEVLAEFIKAVPKYEKEIKLFWDNVDVAIWQFEDAKDWINSFKAAGYKVYILSNYGKHTYLKTKDSALDFLELVDGITFSYEAKLVKPDPAIYKALLAQHALKAEECVFIDDREENIQAARREGLEGIIFTSRAQANDELTKYGVCI